MLFREILGFVHPPSRILRKALVLKAGSNPLGVNKQTPGPAPRGVSDAAVLGGAREPAFLLSLSLIEI